MTVPGKLYQPWHQRVLWVLIIMFATASALAQNSAILLRKGPGSAFPVVSELSPDHSLKAVLRQGEWIKLSDGQRQGWVHQSDLNSAPEIDDAQLWLIRESTPLSQWQLQLGANTEKAYQLGFLYPLHSYDVAFRAERGFDHSENWYSLQLALEKDLWRVGRSWLAAGFALGSGSSEAGAERWNDDGETQTTALAALNFDWKMPLSRPLTLLFRIKNEQALAGNRANDTSLALIWNLKL